MRNPKSMLLTSPLFFILAACGGSVQNPIIPTPPPSTVVPPAPTEAGTAGRAFGRMTGIDKKAPNSSDGVRYVDSFASDGREYDVRFFKRYGATGSPNILYPINAFETDWYVLLS